MRCWFPVQIGEYLQPLETSPASPAVLCIFTIHCSSRYCWSMSKLILMVIVKLYMAILRPYWDMGFITEGLALT